MMEELAGTSEPGSSCSGMPFVARRGLLRFLAAFLLTASVAASPLIAQDSGDDGPARFPDSPYLRIDPEKIVGAETCGECHAQEYQVWRETLHSTQFNTMHRSDQAQGILDRMDFRLAKRESLCLRCHYTAEIDDDQAQALQGVSCESCHGAARDWIDVHNDYGGATHDTETEENRRQRIERSVAAGMLRPSGDLYSVAANCFECHTVPAERLINEGGHPSGSNFELVAWSDSVRHNFLPAQWSDDQTNHAPTTERKRMMFIVGRVLEYEYAIRGVAEASERSSYSKAMERRAKIAFRNLQQLYGVAPVPTVAEILEIGGSLDLTPGNSEALLAGVNRFADLVREMEDSEMDVDLSAIDDLIAGRTPEATAVIAGQSADPPATGGAPGAETGAPDAAAAATEAAAGDTGETPAAAGAPASTPSVTVGQIRSRPAWFPTGQYETTVPGCSCHTQANDWLLDDPHSGSLDLLSSPRANQIAEIYGIDPAAKDVGNNICASCHATVVSGDEAFAVFDPVSCESCHGPSSGYEDPHERGDGAGFDHGMARLKDAEVRAETCARCHYITDERLLASGHPTGEDKDIVAAMGSIRHWPDDKNVNRSGTYPEVSDAALGSAVQAIRASRTVPSVQVVEVQPAATQAAPSQPAASTGGAAAASGGSRPATTGSFAAPQRSRPVSTTPVSLDLEPIPAVGDSTSTEDILLIIKERLERIYRELGRGN